MSKTNKKTLVAGIVICAVSSTSSASNNSITANELSVNEIKFLSAPKNADSSPLNQSKDTLLLRKEISPNDGFELLANTNANPTGPKKRHDGSTNYTGLWDWIFG